MSTTLPTKTRLLNTFRQVFKWSPLERLLAQQSKGKAFGSFTARLLPNHYQYKKGSIRSGELNGVRYQLDISDMHDWAIYFGLVDPLSLQNFLALVKTGDVVLDIGANIGQYSLEAALKVGATGHVFSFEAVPETQRRFAANLAANPSLKNVHLQKVALGETKGSFQLVVRDESNMGMNQLQAVDAERQAVVIEVEPLDHYIEHLELEKIDVIKIDTEGFELNILKGAKQVLTVHMPTLFIELDDKNLQALKGSAKELIGFLTDLGYQVRNARTQEVLEGSRDFTNDHYDIIATPVSQAVDPAHS